jgi:ring-1,2-phenylacetyl-CoA epoxidase subunit PaaE
MSKKVYVGKSNQENEKCETLIATINFGRNEIKYDGKSTVLDALLKNGVDAPYSCQSGSCMACLAKVTSGSVYMDDPYILSEENLKEGECLTCQSFPSSTKVEITYDNL